MAFTKITSDGIGDNAVTSDKIASGAITAADIPNGEITAAKLATTAISDKLGYTPVSPTTLNTSLGFKASTSALGTLAYISPTGTSDTTKFLRGDNSWQAPGLSSLSDLSLSSVAGNDIISYAGTTTSTGGTFTTSNWTLAEWGKSNATVTVNDATSTLVTQLQLLTTGNTITVTKTSGGSSTLTLTGAPTLSYGTTYVIPVNTNSGTGSTESLTTIVIPSGSVTTYSWKNTSILGKPLRYSSYHDITNSNLNNLNVGGVYMGYGLNGANNGPAGAGWAVVEVMTNGNDQVRQKYSEAQYDGGRVYERWSSNGGSTWNSWTIFTKGGKSPAVIGLNAGGDTTTWYNVAPFTYSHVKYYISTHENNYHQFWEITCSSNGAIAWMKAPDAGHAHSSDFTFRISGGYLQCKNVSYTTGRQVFVYSIESA